MARAQVVFKNENRQTIAKIAKSGKLLLQLEPIADEIMSEAQQDPNKEFVASLRKRMFVSSGPRGRASWQVGAHPIIGARVEAKRGVFHRIMARLGF